MQSVKHPLGKLSRWIIDGIFYLFRNKLDLKFHCMLKRNFVRNAKSYVPRKIRKIIQNAIFWNCYPACLALRQHVAFQVPRFISEPYRGKMYFMACTFSEDSDQPAHAQSDDSLRCRLERTLDPLLSKRHHRRRWSDCACAVWSESSLGARLKVHFLKLRLICVIVQFIRINVLMSSQFLHAILICML